MIEGITKASELYAISQGKRCKGIQKCHWCGASCGNNNPHDDPPLILIRKEAKIKQWALYPNNSYICDGCWLWRRKRITVFYLDDSYSDGQSPEKHPWFITHQKAYSLYEEGNSLYETLLSPPLTFSLSLVTPGEPNRLQHNTLNNLSKIQLDTPLSFTLNSQVLTYTIYELQEGILNGANGKEPGVQTLIRILGEPSPDLLGDKRKDPEEKRGRGKPPPLEDGKMLKEVVVEEEIEEELKTPA